MWCILVLTSVFVFGNAGFVGSLPKCGMNDKDCHKNVVQAVLTDISKTGVQELGIPPLDPLQLKNESLSVLGAVDVTLVDGVVKGIKDCVVDDISSDIPGGKYSIEITCDITVKGHYKASSSSSKSKSILGEDLIHGDGRGKVKIEQITTRIQFVPFVFKNKDGEIFISSDIKDTKLDFEIKGDLRFSANNIYLGDEDVSQVVLPLLNQNAKKLAQLFGKPAVDKTLQFIYSFGNKFFETVPAKLYIKEDLTPFVTRIK